MKAGVGMENTSEQKRSIPVDFTGGTELSAVHANQMIIQHTEHEFVVTFFELLPPVLSPDPTQQAEEFGQIKNVRARPVAKVVMSSVRAREFAAALVENLRRFEDESSEPEDEWLVRSGVLQQLLTAASQQQPVEDWERLLDEL